MSQSAQRSGHGNLSLFFLQNCSKLCQFAWWSWTKTALFFKFQLQFSTGLRSGIWLGHIRLWFCAWGHCPNLSKALSGKEPSWCIHKFFRYSCGGGDHRFFGGLPHVSFLHRNSLTLGPIVSRFMHVPYFFLFLNNRNRKLLKLWKCIKLIWPSYVRAIPPLSKPHFLLRVKWVQRPIPAVTGQEVVWGKSKSKMSEEILNITHLSSQSPS